MGVASLYEYFPNKDAIVVLVAERLVQRVMSALDSAIAQVIQQPQHKAMYYWMHTIYQLLLNPPQGVSKEQLLEALAIRIERWLAEPIG